MRSKTLRYEPDYAVPPGETLREILSAVGMSKAELGRRLGRDKHVVTGIIKGHVEITAVLALSLEQALGVPGEFWLALESNYREALEEVDRG